jgi:hypothetical protein
MLIAACQVQIVKPSHAALCIPCIRGDMSFLASDELQGRGSGTRDEHLAALYAASLFAGFGLDPGANGSFLQRVPLPSPLPPELASSLTGFAGGPRTETWNVVGILHGSDPLARKQAILLTAHLDHLGIGPGKNGDRIYNGADDDASGITAVIELARVLAATSPRPARSVLFVLFGSEEIGGYGNQYFLDHSPIPLGQIVASLEFEMIGRRDPALPRDGLWLTGYHRSNLGAELGRHGAALVPDPHPTENFYQRSDNYSLARRGIIAHTVSSFGLHADYHEPSDEISRIDFPHLTRAIASMVEPIEWLAQTTWKPQWLAHGKP